MLAQADCSARFVSPAELGAIGAPAPVLGSTCRGYGCAPCTTSSGFEDDAPVLVGRVAARLLEQQVGTCAAHQLTRLA